LHQHSKMDPGKFQRKLEQRRQVRGRGVVPRKAMPHVVQCVPLCGPGEQSTVRCCLWRFWFFCLLFEPLYCTAPSYAQIFFLHLNILPPPHDGAHSRPGRFLHTITSPSSVAFPPGLSTTWKHSGMTKTGSWARRVPPTVNSFPSWMFRAHPQCRPPCSIAAL
jgi:hypothetical protein